MKITLPIPDRVGNILKQRANREHNPTPTQAEHLLDESDDSDEHLAWQEVLTTKATETYEINPCPAE